MPFSQSENVPSGNISLSRRSSADLCHLRAPSFLPVISGTLVVVGSDLGPAALSSGQKVRRGPVSLLAGWT